MATDSKLKTKKVAGLRISALADGFRRAGRAWTTEAVDVPVSEFTKDQVAALKAEPGLRVTECDIDVAVAAE
jgi:hypothetical protein